MSKILTGITPRGASIRINFEYNGKRYFPTLKLVPTPVNLKHAHAIRQEVLRRINNGTFDFGEFFPESRHAAKTDRPLFRAVAESWLESRRRNIEETTIREYRSVVNTHFEPVLGGKAMAEIGFLELNTLMSRLPVSRKTFNNVLSVLRNIYGFAVKGGIVTANHAEKIEFAVVGDPEPDPLNIEEMAMVLRDMQQHYPEPVAIYFNLAFRIGFRPSEGIDLRWANVDWDKKLLRIASAKVRRICKTTKTGKARLVELDDASMELLVRLKAHADGEHLFLHPNTGKPYADTAWLVQKYWRPTLARCGIRDRDARQTRHTCATTLLMAGSIDRWAAGQLGHSVEMFQRVYSKWLPQNDNRQELAKASAMFARMG